MRNSGVDHQLTEVASLRTDRNVLMQRAFLLEYATLAWMIIEAAVAIGSGLVANSLVLVAFGIDSVIELASAAVLLFASMSSFATTNHPSTPSPKTPRGATLPPANAERPWNQPSAAENAEKTASRIGGALLFLLAVYVVATAGWKLWTRQGAEFSPLGLLVSVLAIPIMYVLSRRKLELAQQLGSRALRADAIEGITCGRLAFVVVAALVAQLLFGAWWVDGAASLTIVYFLIREGHEAWEGEECCDHH
jgi:divalent metal cation (Fe/Co/Zn/Cd) transporter